MELKTLEKHLVDSAKQAMNDAINEALTKYNSPLVDICNEVIKEHREELKELLDIAVCRVIEKDEFKADIQEALQKKIARLLVSSNDGVVEKEFQKYKSDPVIKAKMLLFVEKILRENEEA